jgi:hypothetical protein
MNINLKPCSLMIAAVLLLVLSACNQGPRTSLSEPVDQEAYVQVDNDAAGIYAAVVEHLTQELPEDLWSTPSQLFVLRQTYDSVGNPDAPWADSHEITRSTQEEMLALVDRSHFELVWIDSTADINAQGAVITVGNIHYDHDQNALVSASIYHRLHGVTGKTLVLKKTPEGSWQINGDLGTIHFGQVDH